jgi:hypothetical protein
VRFWQKAHIATFFSLTLMTIGADRDWLNGTPIRALSLSTEEILMVGIKEHMEVIGADGAHVGTVDKVEGRRIKLIKTDSGEGKHRDHHHFIDLSLVAEVEGQKVRLSANANVAVTMEEENA